MHMYMYIRYIVKVNLKLVKKISTNLKFEII